MSSEREKERGRGRDRRDGKQERRRAHRVNHDADIIMPEKENLVCAICNEAVEETSSCLALPDSGNPAHFDCVMKKISEGETLAAGETIAYLGSGTFGVILKNPKSPAGFEIKKKIDFESKENLGQWRKKLSYKL